MTDTILITASLRIERPVDIVREQYRDIDHHIRNDVHPDIHYQWEPSAPGQRKIRTTFRILGVPQFDVSLLEDAPDGSFIIRYLEGTNAGMVLVHRFVPVGDGATEVQLSADAPATLGRKILGPLFKIGARQVMKKALHEDKMDLEKGDYRPGTAAGDFARALEPLDALAARIAAEPSSGVQAARAVVSAACLVTSSDARVDEAERDALLRIAQKLGVDRGWMESTLAEHARAATSEAIATRAKEIGAALADQRAGVEGVVAAAVAALVSHGMALGELEALRAIASAAKVPEGDLGGLIEDADAALMMPR